MPTKAAPLLGRIHFPEVSALDKQARGLDALWRVGVDIQCCGDLLGRQLLLRG
ncbi:hypothetical protein [Synechococcus sp. MIT S1220]|uniref:hypothetical protein n=1 Tax=Synechococcus sp. MIT S1220 TaxID=3082549 RepID=UPI0039AFF4B8